VSVPPRRRETDGRATLGQALAIVVAAFMVGTILHKGVADLSALAQRHAGADFWPALARYLIGNIAGGSQAGAQGEQRAP
jgi:hypothetical protein